MDKLTADSTDYKISYTEGKDTTEAASCNY